MTEWNTNFQKSIANYKNAELYVWASSTRFEVQFKSLRLWSSRSIILLHGENNGQYLDLAVIICLYYVVRCRRCVPPPFWKVIGRGFNRCRVWAWCLIQGYSLFTLRDSCVLEQSEWLIFPTTPRNPADASSVCWQPRERHRQESALDAKSLLLPPVFYVQRQSQTPVGLSACHSPWSARKRNPYPYTLQKRKSFRINSEISPRVALIFQRTPYYGLGATTSSRNFPVGT